MAPNSGATVQKGLRKVAVYKDEEGKKHAFSALCPHLGCLLQVSVEGFPFEHCAFCLLGCLLQLGW
jgi:nitrite reductase/ring-hydroxylating ferredoxin subunit